MIEKSNKKVGMMQCMSELAKRMQEGESGTIEREKEFQNLGPSSLTLPSKEF